MRFRSKGTLETNVMARVAHNSKWKPIYLVLIYRMLRIGYTDEEIAKTLQVDRSNLVRWYAARPELKETKELAEKEFSDTMLPNWIYSKLPAELQQVWKEVVELNEKDETVKVQLLLQEKGKKVKQHLFLHALTQAHFNTSSALAKIGCAKRELDEWVLSDHEFAELAEEIVWHKKNFVEGHLYRLIEIGDVSATTFASKTLNRDRGFGMKLEVDHRVSGGIMHGVVDLTALIPYMKEETRLDLLEAIRKQELVGSVRTVDVDREIAREIANV